MSRWLVIFTIVLFSACDSGGPLVILPKDAPLSIVELGVNKQPLVLQPSAEKYQRFKAWLERNAEGWYPFYVTPPSSGVLVLAEPLRLHFTGSHALITTERGVFEKSVAVSDYAYLTEP